MSKDLQRVVYYSNEDLSIQNNLENAEKIINSFNQNSVISVNDILELYNIQLYFKNKLRLSNWNDEQYEEYKTTVGKFWEIIKNYFISIENSNFLEIFNEINFQWIFRSRLTPLGTLKL